MNKSSEQELGIQIVNNYLKLPLLPINKYITIAKIGVLNWDSGKRCPRGQIKYKFFTEVNNDEFPPGKNPSLDYMPDDQVSPVDITDTNGIRYRIIDLLWFPLIDIFDGIVLKQLITHKKVFPYKLFIDEIDEREKSNRWVSKLLNLVGNNIIEKLKNQM